MSTRSRARAKARRQLRRIARKLARIDLAAGAKSMDCQTGLTTYNLEPVFRALMSHPGIAASLDRFRNSIPRVGNPAGDPNAWRKITGATS